MQSRHTLIDDIFLQDTYSLKHIWIRTRNSQNTLAWISGEFMVLYRELAACPVDLMRTIGKVIW